MSLKDLLSKINDVAKLNGISTPLICGGVPRDMVLKRNNDFTDIDLTTGDQGSLFLAKETAIGLKNMVSSYLVMPDGHARLIINDLKIDFSSNFKIPNIENYLQSKNINDPSSLLMEVYSRDFTCNSLLMSMDLSKIYDLNKQGIPDIKNKIIRTCLDPEISLGFDHKRIIRAIYLAAKLNFTLDPNLEEWIKNHPNLISSASVKKNYLVKKLSKSIKYNKDITVSYLDKLGLWPYLPPLSKLTEDIVSDVTRI